MNDLFQVDFRGTVCIQSLGAVVSQGVGPGVVLEYKVSSASQDKRDACWIGLNMQVLQVFGGGVLQSKASLNGVFCELHGRLRWMLVYAGNISKNEAYTGIRRRLQSKGSGLVRIHEMMHNN